MCVGNMTDVSAVSNGRGNSSVGENRVDKSVAQQQPLNPFDDFDDEVPTDFGGKVILSTEAGSPVRQQSLEELNPNNHSTPTRLESSNSMTAGETAFEQNSHTDTASLQPMGNGNREGLEPLRLSQVGLSQLCRNIFILD